MELFVLGTSQSIAPSAVRERMHVDLGEVHEALGELLTGRGILAEAVPLATCGRLELYAVAEDADRALRVLTRLMARSTGLSSEALRSHSYALRGPTAVRHLLRVAAGLDSVVHGEAQILGQVREAAHHPLSATSKGSVLHRLFENALSTGKRVRAETEIGRGAASLASAAVAMVHREIGALGSTSALVLGAGETGGLVARLLRKAGVGRVVIANRTLESAQELAGELEIEAAALADLPGLLREADLVVGAVTVGDWIVNVDTLDSHEVGESGWPRYFLDLAHPRNFDPALADLPGVHLFDLDHVFQRVEAAREARSAQIPRAEGIVKEQAGVFDQWLRSRESVTLLRAVREQVLDLAAEEAERFARGRSYDEREAMKRLARSLARTLLHPPTMALREADPTSPEGRALLQSAGVLFGVGQDPQDSPDTR